MKISVIICNYNYEKFIGSAIESVLSQTHGDFELIVVDDGSVDDSRRVIDSYSDNRITRIYKENGGQASAFNAGFEASSGKVICLLDSDDWWSDDKLATVAAWDATLSSDYSILQHGLWVWHDGETSAYKNTLPSGDCFTQMCESGDLDFFIPTSGLTISRNIATKIFPIPSVFRICADAFITRASLPFAPVVSIPKPLGYYRKHNNSVYDNQEFKHKEFIRNTLYPELEDFYSENGIGFSSFEALRKNRKRKRLRELPGALKRLLVPV